MRLATLALVSALISTAQQRPISIDDMHKLKAVGDPRCSPDAKWVAYTLSTVDVAGDKRDTDVWMASADGKQNLRVTTSTESESSPKWSPDGKWMLYTVSFPDWKEARRQSDLVLVSTTDGLPSTKATPRIIFIIFKKF